jgi:hypothetical protein
MESSCRDFIAVVHLIGSLRSIEAQSVQIFSFMRKHNMQISRFQNG